MATRSLVTTLAAGMSLSLVAWGAQAQYLQPGMRTMIQQGGVEGTLLGPVLPPFAHSYRRVHADPYYGYAYRPRHVYRRQHIHRAHGHHRPFRHDR